MQGNGKDTVNAGDITIILNGKELTLRPTMRACRTVSRRSGGFAKVRESIINEDFDTVVYVIAVGTNSLNDTAKLEEEVFSNGLDLKLLMPLLEYVAVLNNGGRPLPASMKGSFSMTDEEYREVSQIEHHTNQGNE